MISYLPGQSRENWLITVDRFLPNLSMKHSWKTNKHRKFHVDTAFWVNPLKGKYNPSQLQEK